VLVSSILLLEVFAEALPELRVHQVAHALAQALIVRELLINYLRVVLGEVQSVLESLGDAI
jgi:hypothetical protein